MRVRQETSLSRSGDDDLHLAHGTPAPLPTPPAHPRLGAKDSAALNDAPFAVDGVEPGEWATVEREWHPGDRSPLRCRWSCAWSPVDKQHPNRVAIMFGPTVLAQDEACCRRPFDWRRVPNFV